MPKIDARNFQKLLEEKRNIAPLYTPEWDAADDRDNGVALLKIFTHMQEEVINRLNRVPDKNFTAFLEMIGLKLMPAQPARAPVTFYLPESFSGGVFVPAGTSAAADETEKRKALNFETTKGIFATSAAIEEIYCVDPDKDAIFKYKDDFTNGKEINIFSGKSVQQHILYLGHDELFKVKNPAVIKLQFKLHSGSVDDLIWKYWGGDENNPEDFSNVKVETTGNLVTLTSKGEIKEREINSKKSHWILCTPRNVFNAPVIEQVKIMNVSPFGGTSEEQTIKPDIGFFNNVPLALDKEGKIYPLGEQPRLFDTFYIASREVFSKKNAKITIGFKGYGSEPAPTPSQDIQLSWEYYNGLLWCSLLGKINEESFNEFKNFNFQNEGSIWFYCPPDIKEVEVNGEKNYWIRIRLTEGDYGKDEFNYKSVNNQNPKEHWEVTPNFKPPVIKEINLKYELNNETDLQHCLAYNNLEYRDFTQESQNGTNFKPFIPLPEEHPTLYIGFNDAFKKGNISIFFSLEDADYPLSSKPKMEWTYWSKAPNLLKDVKPKEIAFVSAAGIGSNTELLFEETVDVETITETAIVDSSESNGITSLKEELSYKYARNASVSKRTTLEVTDNTEYLTRTGTLEFIGPPEQLKTHKFGIESYWLMGAFIKQAQKMLIKGIYPNTVWAEQVETIQDEILGSGDGDKNMSYNFFRVPVISPEIWVRHEEIISEDEKDAPSGEDIREIKDDTGKTIETWVRWKIVEDFVDSFPRSRHCTVDNSMGIVQFGDGEYGIIPPIGQDNIKATYKTGGGVLGNVARNEIKTLKSSIAGIDHVTNYEPAEGGSDTELLEGVFERGPHLIKHRYRAVTKEDFERLAKAASSYIARTKCLIKDNKLTVVIIPKGEDDKPQPSKGLIEIVKKSLLERSLNMMLKESLAVTCPSYKEIKITVDVIPESIDLAIPLEKTILRQLKEYLHPLTGGNEGTGWEFGRGVHISDVYALLERIKGVDHVENLTLNDPATSGSPDDVYINEFETVCSGEHRITMRPGS